MTSKSRLRRIMNYNNLFQTRKDKVAISPQEVDAVLQMMPILVGCDLRRLNERVVCVAEVKLRVRNHSGF